MDYYSILGVTKDSSAVDIKKAYRKLAMENHPDRTGGDDTKFKQINEAYDTLKDPDKKSAYDNPQQQSQFNQNFGNYNDIFHNMFGFQRQRRSPNQSIRVGHTLNLSDTIYGKKEFINYTLPSGRSKIIEITIPKGIVNGQIVRYSGLGEDTYKEFPPGNLEIQFRVKNNTQFIINDYDLQYTMPIDYFDLIIGKEQIIRTITGRKINLKIKQGTNPNSTLSVSGEGLYHFNSERRGNLYINFKTIMPNLDKPQLEIIEQLQKELNK